MESIDVLQDSFVMWIAQFLRQTSKASVQKLLNPQLPQ